MNDSLKNCINENWTIRKSFWAPYHFRHFNRNRKFKKINLIKLNVAILLLGGGNFDILILIMKLINKIDFL